MGVKYSRPKCLWRKKVKDKKPKEVIRGKKVGKFITKEDAIRLKDLIVVKNTSEKKRKMSKKKKK